MRRLLIPMLTAGLLISSTAAVAQDGERDDDDEEAYSGNSVGDTERGLAGIQRVGVPDVVPAGLTFGVTAGYGFTEDQAGTKGSSHRVAGRFAIAVRPLDWLAMSLLFDGRYDIHPDDGDGTDDGWVGDPWLLLRGSHRIDEMMFGLEVGVWVPGSEAPSLVFEATTVDIKGLFAHEFDDWTLAANVGYRIDNSDKSVGDVNLRPGDLLALGVSSFDGILFGVGAAYRMNELEILGEFSSHTYVGSGAPGFIESPLRLTGGLRYEVSRGLNLEFLLEGLLTPRPDSVDGFVPTDPRVMGTIGFRYRLPFQDPVTEDERARGPITEGAVRGLVLDIDGRPIRNAEVVVEVGEYTETRLTDTTGRFAFEEVPEGEGTVSVNAEGYESDVGTTTVIGGRVDEHEFALESGQPRGQLRGVVSSRGGEPLEATIKLSPGGESIETDKDGRFEIDLSPGSYRVTVKADGYKSQVRKVVIDENGVTVFNAELRKGKRRR